MAIYPCTDPLHPRPSLTLPKRNISNLNDADFLNVVQPLSAWISWRTLSGTSTLSMKSAKRLKIVYMPFMRASSASLCTSMLGTMSASETYPTVAP